MMIIFEPMQQEDFGRLIENESLNMAFMGLYAFGDTITVLEWYKKVGYQITGIHMKKELK